MSAPEPDGVSSIRHIFLDGIVAYLPLKINRPSDDRILSNTLASREDSSKCVRSRWGFRHEKGTALPFAGR